MLSIYYDDNELLLYTAEIDPNDPLQYLIGQKLLLPLVSNSESIFFLNMYTNTSAIISHQLLPDLEAVDRSLSSDQLQPPETLLLQKWLNRLKQLYQILLVSFRYDELIDLFLGECINKFLYKEVNRPKNQFIYNSIFTIYTM